MERKYIEEGACPFGRKKCRGCNLYRPLYIKSQAGVVEKWDCTLAQQTVLLSELKDQMLRVQKAVESRGNEQIKRQDQFLDLIGTHKRVNDLDRLGSR